MSEHALITLGFALLAAFGAFLVVSQIGLVHAPRLRPGRAIDLAADKARLTGESVEGLTLFEDLPLFYRAFGPLVASLAGLMPKDDYDWVERAIDLLDGPRGLKSPADYYANRVVFAVLGFVGGFLGGVSVAAGGGSPVLVLALPIGLALIGYGLPRQNLQSALSRRRRLILFEAPYLFDRLAVNYLSEQSLTQGLVALTSVPEGGYLMRELRQLAEDNAKGTAWAACLARMKERNDDAPIVQRFCDRLLMAESAGANLIAALNVIGERANQLVENEIRQAGAQNQTLMIVPTLLSLGAIVILLVAPSVQLLGRAF